MKSAQYRVCISTEIPKAFTGNSPFFYAESKWYRQLYPLYQSNHVLQKTHWILLTSMEASHAELRRGFGIGLQLMANVYIILVTSDTFMADMDFKVHINQE